MKKIITTVFLVACLIFAIAGLAQATGTSFTGSTYLSVPGSASVVVSTSTNVYMLYEGNSTASGQTYGAGTKNKAGDKFYATGGGQGSASGIYYHQDSSSVGYVDFSGYSADPSSFFTAGSGWTAQ